MNKLTPLLALALLSHVGTAHAGDDIYITYTNKTNIPLEFIFDTGKTNCFYQTDLPSDILVQPGQSVGPFHGESKATAFTACFFERGDFTLDIFYNNFKAISQCQFIQGFKYNTYDPNNCLPNPQITVNNDPDNNTSEIVVGPFTQNSALMKGKENAQNPNVYKEKAHEVMMQREEAAKAELQKALMERKKTETGKSETLKDMMEKKKAEPAKPILKKQ